MGSVEYGVQIIVHTIIICWLIIPAEILVGHLVEDLMIIEIMSCITGDIIAVMEDLVQKTKHTILLILMLLPIIINRDLLQNLVRFLTV